MGTPHTLSLPHSPSMTPGDKGWFTLKGDLCEFHLGGTRPRRRWFTVDLKFGEVKKLFRVEPYDPATGKGEQRGKIPAHVRKLKKEMKDGHFTPASWAGGIHESHQKHLEIDDKGKVSLRVHPSNPLSILDGGHRFESLKELLEEYANNEEMKGYLNDVNITLQIYLDPEWMKEDFGNLQAGRPVSRSQLQYMEREKETDPEQALVHGLAKALNKNKDSFLNDEVKFISGDNGRVEYASITNFGSSDIGTSLGGGVRIVLHDTFRGCFPTDSKEKLEVAKKFLVECYNSAYQGIFNYGEKESWVDVGENETQEWPHILMPNYTLRPTKNKGTRGGTSLLIMLGNMLAFRSLVVNRKPEVSTKDVKRLVEVADNVFDLTVEDSGGGSGPAKRQLTGGFARRYFEDIIRKDGEDFDPKKLGSIDRVPSLLCEHILSRSTFAVDRTAVEYIPADDVVEGEGTPQLTGSHHRPEPIDTDPEFLTAPDFIGHDDTENEEFTPPAPTPKKRGRKPKKQTHTPSGVMG